MGYCPFSFSVGSRYSKLYHDTAGLGVQQGGHDTASSASRHGHDMTTIRPGGPATRPACARGERHGLAARGESRYKFCIVARGDLLCRNTAQQG